MSCSAMERMVIGAINGTPATASSGTEHFRTLTRAQTPMTRRDSDSRYLCEGFVSDPDSRSDTVEELF